MGPAVVVRKKRKQKNLSDNARVMIVMDIYQHNGNVVFVKFGPVLSVLKQ